MAMNHLITEVLDLTVQIYQCLERYQMEDQKSDTKESLIKKKTHS